MVQNLDYVCSQFQKHDLRKLEQCVLVIHQIRKKKTGQRCECWIPADM